MIHDWYFYTLVGLGICGWLLIGVLVLRLDSRMGDMIFMLSDSRHAPKTGLCLFICALVFWPIFRLCLTAWFAGYEAAQLTQQWLAKRRHAKLYGKIYNTRDLLAQSKPVVIGKKVFLQQYRRFRQDRQPTDAWVFFQKEDPTPTIIPDQETCVDVDGTFQVIDEQQRTFWVRTHHFRGLDERGPHYSEWNYPAKPRSAVIEAKYQGDGA